ncbi:MAG: hypothetical protein Q8N56_04505 [bacterium]|nr:hypothetical protein [bacterium]
MIKTFLKEYGSVVFVGVLDVILVLIIVFLPMRAIISDSRLAASLKATWLSLENQEQNFEILNKSYQGSLAGITVVENSFVSGEEPVEFLTFLEKLAGSLGLSFETNIFVSQALKQDKWPSMIFQISGEGGPEQTMEFLEKLENNPYLAEIVDFSLSRPSKTDKGVITGSGEGNIKSDFSIKVYIK